MTTDRTNVFQKENPPDGGSNEFVEAAAQIQADPNEWYRISEAPKTSARVIYSLTSQIKRHQRTEFNDDGFEAKARQVAGDKVACFVRYRKNSD